MSLSSFSLSQTNASRDTNNLNFLSEKITQTPRTLKEFLRENPSSCSSSGFKSFPRHPPNPNFKIPSSQNREKLIRSRSTTSLAIQSVINAIKSISFTSVKSSSLLPRSFSRRLSRRASRKEVKNRVSLEVKTTVKVKDIIRWTSFRDIVENESRPLDLSTSPAHYTTTNTTTTTTTTTTCSSNSSSWCDSDFTSEFLPSWNGNSDVEEELGKCYLPCVGMESTDVKEDQLMEFDDEEEQYSHVSVLTYQFGDEEETVSSFDQSLANVQRAKEKLMQKIGLFETLAKMEPNNIEKWLSLELEEETSSSEEQEQEEKAFELLNQIQTTLSLHNTTSDVSQLMLDFIWEQMASKESGRNEDDHEEKLIGEIMREVKGWMNGEHRLTMEWEVEDHREAYVKQMDRGVKWNKCEDEKEEINMEIENGVLSYLVDELLVDIFGH